MATKDQMSEEIEALAEELGLDVDVSEMTSRELVALLSDLKAKKKDKDRQTQADQPKKEEPFKESAAQYRVIAGKSITTRHHVVHQEDEKGGVIKAAWLGGGQRALDELVERGVVEKV